MSRQGTIFCYNSPFIIQPTDAWTTNIDHRLHSQGHSGLQSDAFSSSGKIRHFRVLVEMLSNSMTYQVTDYSVSEFFCIRLDSGRNIIQMIARFCIFYTFEKALSCHFDQLLCFFADLTNSMGSCCIGMIAFVNNACVQTDNIAFLDHALFTWNSMNHLIVDRYTDGCRISAIIFEGGDTSVAADDLLSQMVNIPGRHSGLQSFFKLVMSFRQDFTSFSHKFDFPFRFNGNCHIILPESLQCPGILHP